MSKKIIGITVGTQLPKPDFTQNDPTKGDYIKNKPDFDSKQDKLTGLAGQIVGFDANGNAVAQDAPDNGGTTIIMSETTPDTLEEGDYWDMVMTNLEAPKAMILYTVTFVDGEGYAINGGTSPVCGGDNYSFTIAITEGYEMSANFAVKANGVSISASNGVYTISDVSAHQTITVDGIVRKTYTVTMPSSQVGYTVTSENGSTSPVNHGDGYSFRVTINNGYEANSSFAVKANGNTLTAVNGVYTISNITANQTVTVEGVTEIKTIVNVTGTGNSTYCYATINGTKYSSATSNLEVKAGDTITFGIYGRSSSAKGTLTIDGSQVLSVTNQQTQTYNWTVPEGVKTITINMSYTSSTYQRKGVVTVTTTK